MVSERKFLSMAPVTKRKGNRFSTLHDVDDCEESVHEDQGTTKGDNEEVQVAMRIQIEELTAQLAKSRVMDLQTLLQSTERRDVDHLYKLMLIGGRVGSNWISQNFQGGCNLRNFWIG